MMLSVTDKQPVVGRARRCAGLVLAVGLLLGVGGAVAPVASAEGVAFQRGDIAASVDGGIDVYAPDGTLRGTFAAGTGAESLCFDPNGRRLVAVGVGLFDASGNVLPSKWGSLESSYGECAADGLGHVYVAQGPSGVYPPYASCVEAPPQANACWGTIRKYDLAGDLLRSYGVATDFSAYGSVANLDVTPDPCLLYYGQRGEFDTAVHAFDVCANKQEPSLTTSNADFRDQLRVLPDWRMAWTRDYSAVVLDASGQIAQTWPSSVFGMALLPELRLITLDPDGASFWVGGNRCGVTCGNGHENALWHLDPSSTQPLAAWSVAGTSLAGIAAYAPPLLGDADVEGTVDSNPAGTAEAFRETARSSRQLSGLRLYVDARSTAAQVVLGVYSDRKGHPGTLREQATIGGVRAGSWNYVKVEPLTVAAGERYWVAVLGPRGGGTIRFRDAPGGSGSETSAVRNLTVLPQTWSTGSTYGDGHLSAYGS